MEDYKKRMQLEYSHLTDKIKKLRLIIAKANAGTLDFALNCPLELLKQQLYHMEFYQAILEARAEIENLTLSD